MRLTPQVPDVTSTGAQFMVNLWGTEDVMVDYGVAGYRDELGGYTADPFSSRQLFNIEIIGATHYDYMRREDADEWNLTASSFVTDLMIASKDKDTLEIFLTTSSEIQYDPVRKVWVVDLGWQP